MCSNCRERILIVGQRGVLRDRIQCLDLGESNGELLVVPRGFEPEPGEPFNVIILAIDLAVRADELRGLALDVQVELRGGTNSKPHSEGFPR